MKRILTLFALALLALVATSCQDNLPPDPGTPVEFRGVLWRLESIVSNGQTERVADAPPITLQFSASTFDGIGPCSRHSGAYTATGTAMTIRDFVPGDASCLDNDLQTRYNAALVAVESYLATESTLRLYASGGSVVLTYVRATANPIDTVHRNAPITGKLWRLVTIETSRGMEFIDTAILITMSFPNERELSGRGKCVSFFGRYESDSVALSILALEKTSGDPCDLDERHFDHLRLAETYHSTDSTLVISLPQGKLHYVRYIPENSGPRNAPIIGKEWRLRLISEGGTIMPASTEHGISIVFNSETTFVGLGACSRYGGIYSSDGTSLTVPKLESPELPCGDSAFERRYVNHLRKATQYFASDSVLRIVTSGAILSYERVAPGTTRPPVADTAIAGSRWKLVTILDRNDELEAPPGTMTVLTFGPRRLEGKAQCNDYGAFYTANNGAISVRELTHTEKACPNRRFEEVYFDALPTAREYQIDVERLTIMTARGSLRFVRLR